MKTIVGVKNAPGQHWVGDGFPVRSMFTYQSHGETMSPFLLLDRGGPAAFDPAQVRRGVGQHPHRGFETVTIVYRGEVAHRDSTGQGGVIGPGDVQWMTAGSGILHEEFHSESFARTGGILDMVQLWVNLPAENKMSAPRYQALLNDTIPSVPMLHGAGSLRVIAGSYEGHNGPASTFSPMDVWDLQLKDDAFVQLPARADWNTSLIVLHGAVEVNGQLLAREGQMVLLERAGSGLTVRAKGNVTFLLLSGEPIDEPIVGSGPFVMNSQEEITQAYDDFRSGRFGQIAA